MTYLADHDTAECTTCGKNVLLDDGLCQCGDVFCDYHACPTCQSEVCS